MNASEARPLRPPFAISVAVLAGGLSTRMGIDKAFVRVQGVPMIERVLAQVRGLGSETLLIANQPERYAHLGLPVCGDVVPGAGALGGIYSAVHHAAHGHVLVVACDMPFLARPLLEHLASLAPGFDVVVPRVAGMAEPLHAVYSKACLAPIRRRLDAGRYRAIGFYGDVRVRYVEEGELRAYDPALHAFVNVNTPGEAAAADDPATG